MRAIRRRPPFAPTARRAALAALALLAPLLPLSGCAHDYKAYEAAASSRTWELGGVKVEIEVAKDIPSRQRGLSHRASMPADHGMLFVYPEPKPLSFWMKDCAIPLSIAFFEELPDGKARVVNIEDMEPFVESTTISQKPVRLALEMNQGWFARRGLKEGDVVDLPPWLADVIASEDE